MASAATIAATARHQITVPSADATAVPTSTGTTAAGRVRGRAPATQRFIRLWPPRELGEIGFPLLAVRVAALLRFFAHVEEQVGVVGQLLDAGQPVLVGVEAGLQ